MNVAISCLVGESGHFHVKVGQFEHGELLEFFKCEEKHWVYVFDLGSRLPTRPMFNTLARNFFDKYFATPEKLMEFIKEAKLSKTILAGLLDSQKCRFYSEVCGAVEKTLTEACRAMNNTCLEGGCAMDDREACLNACRNVEEFYNRFCVNAWLELFKNSSNRTWVWKK